MDIRQILHHLRQGSSYRQTGLVLGMDWRTVKKYHRWAEAHSLLGGTVTLEVVISTVKGRLFCPDE